MMGMIWVVIFVALTGTHFGYGSPVRSTPQAYPHELTGTANEGWGSEGGMYATVPALALVLTAVGLLFGCTWCYRHKDCKPNEGGDNQLFSATATHLHAAARVLPPDSGFSEPANNNISEDNNNGPISLREMQNIANNNATAYIVSENEERNRVSRESVVEFEPLPLPTGLGVADPLEHCADWFSGEDFSRNRLQYLREIDRGWFGRVVEGEVEDAGSSTAVAVKILNQNASLEDKARFLDEAKLYRDVRHENILRLVDKCLQEDPWILILEICSMDLQQYLEENRPKMAILNESGVPLRLMCDITSALTYLHSRGYLYGNLWTGSVLVRDAAERPQAVLGRYNDASAPHDHDAPETHRNATYTTSSEVWSLGTLVWEVCAWGASPPRHPPPAPELPCPYRNHLYQVMQLCWNPYPGSRPTAGQVHALLEHLRTTQARSEPARDHSPDFEDRWQRLKPNSIPKVDEHVAIVHAPSTSREPSGTLDVDMRGASRSSSVGSDCDPLSTVKSESLTNLHGSLEDVRNIYLTHDEPSALECHHGNVAADDRDKSDASLDPWLKDIVAGSQDDVSYYKDVSDVIKNLDNILNSEKTSSSESSHQASPSRDNLTLDCRKERPVQSSLVKSPGISDFQSFLDGGFASKAMDSDLDEDLDRDTVGTLSHSFERHGDSTSQHTLENLTPDTPMKDLDFTSEVDHVALEINSESRAVDSDVEEAVIESVVLPKEIIYSDRAVPKLKQLCEASVPGVASIEQTIERKDCQTFCDNIVNELGSDNNEISKSVSCEEEKEEVRGRKSPKSETIKILLKEENVDIKEMPNTFVNVSTFKETEVPSLQLQSPNKEEVDIVSLQTRLLGKSHIEQIETNSLENTAVITVHNSMSPIKDKGRSTKENEISEVMNDINTSMNLSNDVDFLASPRKQNFSPKYEEQIIKHEITTLSNAVNKIAQNLDKLQNTPVRASCEDASPKQQAISKEDILQSEATKCNDNENTTVLTSDLVDVANNFVEQIQDNLKLGNKEEIKEHNKEKVNEEWSKLQHARLDAEPELVQSIIDKEGCSETFREVSETNNSVKGENKILGVEEPPVLPPEIVQNKHKEADHEINDKDNLKLNLENVSENKSDNVIRSDNNVISETNEQSDESTVYMDLINYTNNDFLKESSVNTNIIETITSNFENLPKANDSLEKTESTVYMDLPSFQTIKQTDDFLHMERVMNGHHADHMCASTPIASDASTDRADSTLGNSIKESDTLSETKVLDNEPTQQMLKLEQKCYSDILSPFDSPTKSHQTDTYDENSSVVLGPFENCSLELFKGGKSHIDAIEIPKEELLAFSSNFSEINLETPSPLRDVNFLNEVPDLPEALESLHFDDIRSIEDPRPSNSDPQTENITEESGETEKRVSPSTPPNSPGVFLASTSQQKYLVDIDMGADPAQNCGSSGSLQKEIDLNQIELQLTSKLAMAENENNMNIEYSGPLTVEGIVSEEGESSVRESDAIPESFLAGNGGSAENDRELALDAASFAALRNELELKLPLAQVAAIEPQCDGEWSSELPPPPELVVSYPGALSPIAEETGQQLSAYENDINWTASTRTNSSESYPEPCNNSTDDVTELPTGALCRPDAATYTLNSRNDTYTVRDSRELTMSADSLNGSPRAPVDDRTFSRRDDEPERLSQESPFLVSPTADTDAADTRLSTLSRTTAPTDAKRSKPSDAQCPSKATSIDSWCSNDTLYNVEENFDDLALDPDPAPERAASAGSDTLHDDRDLSRCSTYIVHDTDSDRDAFSPDSIAADDCTYTKARVSAPDDDSGRNTPTRDLAYGTLLSGLPSYSNCTTDLASGLDDAWRLPQPELVRRSPVGPDARCTPPRPAGDKEPGDSPRLTAEPALRKMDSVDVSCLQDDLADGQDRSGDDGEPLLVEIQDSPSYNYRNMTPSVTSTPLAEAAGDDGGEPIPMRPPTAADIICVPNFHSFQQSAEVRPQDLSSDASADVAHETTVLLEGDSGTLSRNSLVASERTPTYSDFESSAFARPQEAGSRDSGRSVESGLSSEEFRAFESSVRGRPQDLSAVADASALMLHSERLAATPPAPLVAISPPSFTNLIESHDLVYEERSIDLVIGSNAEETEQPHSIIVTEAPAEHRKESPNVTYDSHTEGNIAEFNYTYDSHGSTFQPFQRSSIFKEPKINGEVVAPKPETPITDPVVKSSAVPVSHTISENGIPTAINSTVETVVEKTQEGKCNGAGEKFATVNFLVEPFEELPESIVDDRETKQIETLKSNEWQEADTKQVGSSVADKTSGISIDGTKLSKAHSNEDETEVERMKSNGISESDETLTSVTQDFLQNEKIFCQLDSYIPLLSDIRFTGPATEIMSTSFTQDSPTEPTSPEREQDSKPTTAADILKDWDSDSESHTSNSSSGEFIWKQRGGGCGGAPDSAEHGRGSGGGASDGSADSGSGSEGDEVEFVPSSWDCRAEPSKSSLRSLEQAPLDSKKRVVFKRQKYHCVYEYPREAADLDAHSPYLPDLSTYSEWDPSSAEEAELCYGQLFSPAPLPLGYPLPAGVAFGADYDEDFFISSSARPFESLGLMSTASQFFPGMHCKALGHALDDDASPEPPSPPPAPPAPLAPAAPPAPLTTRAPSLDLTTPDSGVEDVTPGSAADDEERRRPAEPWRTADSASSSESVSPSSPGGEALGGLRHTRDRLKLDLPPSPHAPSPRQARVFSFTLDKPKRRERPPDAAPLVMSDDTPVAPARLPADEREEPPPPEPTFSTFGKPAARPEPEPKIVLTDSAERAAAESEPAPEPGKEGTPLDSGDEDSGIESSSKATLERSDPPDVS